MAAGSVLQVMEELRHRLATNSGPKKLWKSLERLSALPVSVAILVETRVGKTVSRLHNCESVRSLTRNLVAQWKKLALTETLCLTWRRVIPKSAPGILCRRMRQWRVTTKNPPAKLPEAQQMAPRHGQKNHGRSSDTQRPHQVSHGGEGREKRMKSHSDSPVYSSEPESSVMTQPFHCPWVLRRCLEIRMDAWPRPTLHARGLTKATLMPLRTDRGSGGTPGCTPGKRSWESKHSTPICLQGQTLHECPGT